MIDRGRWMLIGCTCTALLTAGCGGDVENAAVPVAPKKAAAGGSKGPPPVPIKAAVVDESEGPAPAEEQAPDEPEIDPSIDPNTIFRIVEEPPKYEVLGPAPRFKPTDQFAVASVPSSTESSSTFAVVEVPEVTVEGSLNPDVLFPEGFSIVETGGYSSEGLPRRIRCEADGALMALVQGGPYRQGVDGAAAEAGPAFEHHLSSFYIDVTEVTVAQYKLCQADRRERELRVPEDPSNASGPEDHPVVGISYNDARAYAVWAGKELPTEAQWERTARGPQNTIHPWGNSRAIWKRDRGLSEIDAVKSFLTDASPEGIYDLAGNAREWCLDWYHPEAYQQAAKMAAAGSLRDWTGPRTRNKDFERVVRGNGPNWESWYRAPVDMRERPDDVGFRCVFNADLDRLKRYKIEFEKRQADDR